MSSMDMLDVGQANELKLACRRNSFTPDDLKWLCEGNTLSQVRKVRLGHAVITLPEDLVDLDADPFIPGGLTVPEGCHQKGGQFKWDASRVALFLSEPQKRGPGTGIDGNKLRKMLKGKNPYNANLLDYLLANPHLIPEGWKGKYVYVYFWGTIYRDSCGRLYARCLFWDDGKWHSRHGWIGGLWSNSHPAAVPVG